MVVDMCVCLHNEADLTQAIDWLRDSIHGTYFIFRQFAKAEFLLIKLYVSRVSPVCM